MDFWTRLRAQIKTQNTTQEWIARKIGVPYGTFRKWMNRKTYPNVKEGHEIAKLLETSIEYLLTGFGPEYFYDDEQKLLQAYRKLSPQDKRNAMLAINAWAEKTKTTF